MFLISFFGTQFPAKDSVAILFIAYTGSLQAGCFNHGVVTIIDNAYELSNCIRQQAGLDQITTLVHMVLTVTCFHPYIYNHGESFSCIDYIRWQQVTGSVCSCI